MAEAPHSAERVLLALCVAATALLFALTGLQMANQDGPWREVALVVVPAPALCGLAACLPVARRDRRMWWAVSAFAVSLPFALDALTRSRVQPGEDNCGAPGPLPYGWDGGVVDNLVLALWPVGLALVVAGLVLLRWPAWRPAGWRVILAGAAAFALMAWVAVRCVGT